MGVAFGMVLLSSPLAIVLYFLAADPLLGGRRLRQRDPGHDAVAGLSTPASSPLIGERLTDEQWGQLATSSALWILLPLALGFVRLMRSELK